HGMRAPTPEGPNARLAPQATLTASVAQGVCGGGLPWDMVGYGAAIAAAIIVLDEWLKRRESTWRAPVLAVAVGIYLPLELAVPLLICGLVGHPASRPRGGRGAARAAAQHGRP